MFTSLLNLKHDFKSRGKTELHLIHVIFIQKQYKIIVLGRIAIKNALNAQWKTP